MQCIFTSNALHKPYIRADYSNTASLEESKFAIASQSYTWNVNFVLPGLQWQQIYELQAGLNQVKNRY